MGCDESDVQRPVEPGDEAAPPEPGLQVERAVDLDADPAAVWDELLADGFLGERVDVRSEPGGRLRVDPGTERERVGVVERVEPGRHLSFWWTPVSDAEGAPPSLVELDLEPLATGTRLRVRETAFDAARLVPRALARA